jgi:hypothetical protein
MNRFKILLLSFLLTLGSCDVLNQINLRPTNMEVINALKEILTNSAFRAVNTVRQIYSEGAESLLPPEIQPVINVMRTIGLGGEIDKVNSQINSVSLAVLNESGGLMEDAIKQLTFSDAVAVVTGGPDAATLVLKNAMYGAVKDRYASRLDAELDKTEVMKFWTPAVNAYNMFSSNKIEKSLSEMIAEKAVDVLFDNMASHEAAIRNDYESLGSNVVNKVFDYYVANKRT